MKCFYHTDMDGKCSAAIVQRFYGEVNIDHVPMNYAIQFPFDQIKPNETVIIVDFSLQKEGDFEKLLNITENITWIDHHKSAIEKHSKISGVIDGIRESGIAGCELTWRHFFPSIEEIPDVVKYIADYDLWKFEYGDATKELQAGIRLWNTHPADKNWKLWIEDPITLDEVFEAGKLALNVRRRSESSYVNAHSFRVEFESHKAIACNLGSTNSSLFDSIKERDFDLMMPFHFDGSKWTVSIFTESETIDCSEIAKKHGGGGHKKAAGFVCTELPFKKS